MINLLKNKGEKGSVDQNSCQVTVVLNIVAFLGEREGMLQRLSLESGVMPQQLRYEMTDPEIQAGIVDFLLNDEALLIQFCKNHRMDPAEIWKIRLKLPGAPV